MTYRDIVNNYQRHSRGSASRLRTYIQAFGENKLDTEIDPKELDAARNVVSRNYDPTSEEIDAQAVAILLHP